MSFNRGLQESLATILAQKSQKLYNIGTVIVPEKWQKVISENIQLSNFLIL